MLISTRGKSLWLWFGGGSGSGQDGSRERSGDNVSEKGQDGTHGSKLISQGSNERCH